MRQQTCLWILRLLLVSVITAAFVKVTAAFVKACAILPVITIYFVGPLYSGPAVSAITFAGLRAVRARRAGASHQVPLFKSHRCALTFPLAAPLLWFFAVLADALGWGGFLQCLFFLPVMCAFSLEPPDAIAIFLILACVPGQYALMGALVDILRRPTRSRRAAWAFLLGALCGAGVLRCFMSWAFSGSPWPPQGAIELAVIVVFYSLITVGLAMLAVRTRASARETPCSQD